MSVRWGQGLSQERPRLLLRRRGLAGGGAGGPKGSARQLNRLGATAGKDQVAAALHRELVLDDAIIGDATTGPMIGITKKALPNKMPHDPVESPKGDFRLPAP